MKKNFLYFLYNFALIPGLHFFFPFLKNFSKGLDNYITVREDNSYIKKIFNFKKLKSCNIKTIWFHASSLGEYEQAKPIINMIRSMFSPGTKIVVSFFSSSGYNYAKNELYDLKFYLPFDSKKNAEIIVTNIKPDILFFLGYDVWFNILFTMKKHNKKVYLINGTVKEKSLRINTLTRKIFKFIYSYLDGIYVVSKTMKNRYSKIYDKNKIVISGDTRFDNVIERKKKVNSEIIKKIFNNKFILVIGSSHTDDEKIILPGLKLLFDKISSLLLIFAPHNVSNNKTNYLIKNFQDENISFLKYSVFEQNQIYNNEKIILVDSIGKLFDLYSLGDCAYIGGSFKQGVHNIMEPAVFNIPIITGPVFRNSNEANELNEKKLLYIINNTMEFYNTIIEIYNKNEDEKNKFESKISEYIHTKTGASKRIFNDIIKYL